MDKLGEQFAAEPEELSSRRLRRFMLILGFLIVAVAAVVVLVPGLESLRDSFSGAKPGWLAIAAGLEVLSCLSYVIVFRGVFCARSRWVTSYDIRTAELATNSVLSVGGAGGLALGAGILRRGGMPAVQIARRSVAFFLLTSLANVTALIVAGAGLWTGVLHGSPSAALSLLPAAAGMAAIALVLTARPLARRLAGRTRRCRVVQALEALAGGVDQTLSLLRSGNPLILVGAAGYMLFDVAVLGVCFHAFGNEAPPGGILLLAYVIGQLGGLIPTPAGIGGVDAGLIGTLVLYGTGAADAAVAVLAYHALVLWVPIVLGVPSLASLRRRPSVLRRRAQAASRIPRSAYFEETPPARRQGRRAARASNHGKEPARRRRRSPNKERP
jgi:uncharacterized membrane protein YbhN (UPF0104 family)